MVKFNDINDVEIFQAGRYPQGEYTEKDLDEMIASFEMIGDKFKPYLKLGHNTKQVLTDGQPALGWITNLKRKGAKILADFKNMPQKLYELITKGAYRRVSAEIYPEYEYEGKKFKNVLKAVALLGGDTPQIKTLDDIVALGFSENEINIIDDTHAEYNVKILKYGEDAMTEAALKVLQDKQDSMVKEFTEKENSFKAKEKEFTEAIKTKDEEIKKLKEENTKQFTELEQIREEKQTIELEKKVEEYIEKKKIVPAQKDKVISMFKKAKTDEERKELEEFIESQEINLNTEGGTNHSKPNSDNTGEEDPDGSKLDTKVQKYMEEHKDVSYGEAYRRVASE